MDYNGLFLNKGQEKELQAKDKHMQRAALTDEANSTRLRTALHMPFHPTGACRHRRSAGEAGHLSHCIHTPPRYRRAGCARDD